MPNRIVHIGFPKTATTFLQWRVYPNLKGINYISYAECRELFQPIIYSDPLDYSVEDIEPVADNSLYSFESLAGSPFYYKGIGRSNIPHSLSQMGFNKVIITIREQAKAIDSYYRQYVVQGGTLSFKNWLDIDNKRPLPQKYFRLNYLCYDGLLRRYADVFGKENVLVLSQEMLKKDASAFVKSIEVFTDSNLEKDNPDKKANESLSNLSITLLRFVNHFAFSSVRPFHLFSRAFSNRPIWKVFAVILDPYCIRFFSKRKSYVQKYGLEKRLQEFYKTSNLQLKKDWWINLQD